MSKVIVLATPVFLLLIALEYAWGRARQRAGTGRDTYRLNDTLNSVSLGMMSQLSGVLTKALQVGIYTAAFASVALMRHDAFWGTWYGVVLALLLYDFCYYWLHRAGHEVALFWAAHVVHHQSQAYNLSTALRQSGTGNLLGWIFYLPMAVVGVPPVIFGIVALIDLLYQFWVHTEHVPKLGWFDRVFCSPSNHRVHHAVNDGYVDKNYGGVLVVWDRLFGTFREETVPCVYGTRSALKSWDPLWANAEVYWALMKESWRARRWTDKLLVWFKPPGWQSAEMAQSSPKPPFDITRVQTFHPPMSRRLMAYSAAWFAVLLGGIAHFLWHVDGLALSAAAVWCAMLTVGLWTLGAVMQRRLGMGEGLLVASAVLTTATSALGLVNLHQVFKPLTILIAILLIANHAISTWAYCQFSYKVRVALLLGALAASLAGDVFLMLPGNYFIAGLASFLVAHLFYIALFRVDTAGYAWFPAKRVLAATGAAGVAMYAFIYPGLGGTVLKLAVAAYVLVIALMAAQAIGRFTAQLKSPALAVAVGACFFMLSDSLLATNRFVQPLPMSQLWVLSTYYIAQLLIVLNVLPRAQGAET